MHSDNANKNVVVVDADDDDDDEMDLGAIGFMFDAQHARCSKRLEFPLPPVAAAADAATATPSTTISVTVRLIGEDPGHVQSGQYLWPAAAFTARYLIDHWWGTDTTNTFQATAVVELGAGVGVAGLVAAQLPGCRQVVLTDYDPGSLQLLRENIALNSGAADAADSGASPSSAVATGTVGVCECSVAFLEWGNLAAGNALLTQDLGSGSSGTTSDETPPSATISTTNATLFPLVLGTDLLYSADIVAPLFTTAKQLMRRGTGEDGAAGRFLLVSSFYPGQVRSS